MTEVVKVTIDGKELEAGKGELLIKVAEDHGIFIPRFCWHERMKPVGMCRMCLVEVEGMRGLPPACTTTVTDGMVVHTTSDAVRKAQDGVLEFLLVNHPLDCPVCDRGGECPLQDQTLAFGPGESRFVEEKRHWEKPIALSDLVLLDRERCIQCARCTRFADEIAGDPLITFAERGDRTEVLTFPEHPFASYFSGNTVQICPVGALTSKPYRFRARPWDLATVETSCVTCAVQCRGALQSSSNRLVRFLGVDSEPVNHGWLCDKGRYGFEYVHAADRVLAPRVRHGEALAEVSWPEALDAAAHTLARVRDLHGPGAIALLGGARGTNEDAYLWARLVKGVLGSDHADAQLGDGLPADLLLGVPRATIRDCDRAALIVLLGPDLKEELPVLGLRVRRAAVELGVPVADLSPADHGLSRYATVSLRPAPGEQAAAAARLAAALAGETTGDGALDALAARVRDREGPVVVVLGRTSLAESPAAVARAAAALAGVPAARFLSALRRGNVHGALDMGLTPGFLPGRISLAYGRAWFGERWGRVPEAPGLDAAGILAAAAAGRIHALVLLGADPLADFPDRALARDGLAGAGTVIAVDAFLHESARRADVFLPCTLWGEKAGTATNLEGRVQRLGRKLAPEGTTMDDWRIAAELALRLGTDFDLVAVNEVVDEIAQVAPVYFAAGAELVRRARDGVVVPVAEHAHELVLGRPEHVLTKPSWEPIMPGLHEAAGVTRATELVEVTGTGSTTTIKPGIEGSGPDDAAGDERAAEVIGEEGRAAVAAGPPLHRWDGAVSGPATPARDAYALRLVSGRPLYDRGRAVTGSPSIAGLARTPALLVSPADLGRLGVPDGADVRVTSARASVTLPVRADVGVPAGVARLDFAGTPGGPGAADLVDAGAAVTDLRVETLR